MDPFSRGQNNIAIGNHKKGHFWASKNCNMQLFNIQKRPFFGKKSEEIKSKVQFFKERRYDNKQVRFLHPIGCGVFF